jgi:hypothetical protein
LEIKLKIKNKIYFWPTYSIFFFTTLAETAFFFFQPKSNSFILLWYRYVNSDLIAVGLRNLLKVLGTEPIDNVILNIDVPILIMVICKSSISAITATFIHVVQHFCNHSNIYSCRSAPLQSQQLWFIHVVQYFCDHSNIYSCCSIFLRSQQHLFMLFNISAITATFIHVVQYFCNHSNIYSCRSAPLQSQQHLFMSFSTSAITATFIHIVQYWIFLTSTESKT